ncbi:hypothetical protein LAD77_00245 [Klebsiella pneumoniae]|nr:hypothetical protein [Klebsiella pneumoniae]
MCNQQTPASGPIDLLKLVAFHEPARGWTSIPHQLSGGNEPARDDPRGDCLSPN